MGVGWGFAWVFGYDKAIFITNFMAFLGLKLMI
jgi:hypothetical protein